MVKHVLFDRELPEGWALTNVDAIKASEKSACVAGPFGSNISSKYFVAEGVPVIRGSNLTDDLTRFVPENFVFVSPERAASYRAQHVRAGDLVFTCWGTIGQVGLIPANGPFPEYVISNKQLKLRPNTGFADPLYLFYYFASPQMVAHVKNRAIGAAVPGINLGILKALEVVLPPLADQRRIASILSAYDDLIENNTRRIAILEEMARRIYEEWFVRFRFPGHEDVRMVDSELGPVPEGWRVVPLAAMVETQYGYTESATENPIGPKFLRGMDINKQPFIEWSRVPHCPIQDAELPKFKLSVGDVVVIRMADPGKIGIVEKDISAVFASYLVRLRIIDQHLTSYFLFYFLTGVPGLHHGSEHRNHTEKRKCSGYHWYLCGHAAG